MKNLLMAMLLTAASVAVCSAQTPAVVAGDNVCMRSNPNESSKLTGPNYHHFYTGDQIMTYGTVGNYYKIKYGGGFYYLPKQYVRLRGVSSSNSEAYPEMIIVCGDDVCLRSQPNEASKMTGPSNPHFYTGEYLKCVGVVGNYYKVEFNNRYYYFLKKYARAR